MKELHSDYPVFEFKGEVDQYELIYELHPNEDRDGRRYEMVGQFLADKDFYQGLNMVTVIRNVETGALYGYFWWNDISKHGESYIEENGEEFGLENDTSADDFNWDEDWISYYVFEPVEEYSIKAFRATQ